jgi:hypothetical protein
MRVLVNEYKFGIVNQQDIYHKNIALENFYCGPFHQKNIRLQGIALNRLVECRSWRFMCTLNQVQYIIISLRINFLTKEKTWRQMKVVHTSH